MAALKASQRRALRRAVGYLRCPVCGKFSLSGHGSFQIDDETYFCGNCGSSLALEYSFQQKQTSSGFRTTAEVSVHSL